MVHCETTMYQKWCKDYDKITIGGVKKYGKVKRITRFDKLDERG